MQQRPDHPESGPRYWFAAKRYGWGWGMPLTWQGWATYLIWLASFLAGLAALGLRHRSFPHVIFVVTMVAVLLAVCYWKGEPPRWRWGE
ncbi:MAG TPA: hypothetical protein VMF03_20025 [Steroidobacteraceae bacterium]|nr:hypothetical protein [Steroidobacteraceae bacterium]